MIKRLYFSIVFFAVCLCVYCQQNKTTSIFSYPFHAGDSEWKKFSDNQERINALQIPQNILKKISTEDLLEICLDFPFLVEILFADDFQTGFESLCELFNGYKELSLRNDLDEVIFMKSKNLSKEVEKISILNNTERATFSIKWLFIEMLMIQDYFLDKFSTSKEKIISSFEINDKIKKKYANIFGQVNFIPYKLLLKKSKTISIPRSVTNIYTPNGSLLQDTYVYNDTINLYNLSQTEYLYGQVGLLYPHAQIISDEDFRYNCHGYAWYMSGEISPQMVWIGVNNVTTEDVYWTDGSYIEVTENNAQKISYNELGNHSAIKMDNTWYQSKWGASFLVKHYPNEVPAIYRADLPKKYYRRAQIYGNEVPSINNVYGIENLPVECNVVWSFQGVGDDISGLIQSDYPQTNCCVINNPDKKVITGILTGSVYRNSVEYSHLTKTINTSPNFSATFSQNDNFYLHGPFNIPETPFNNNDTLLVLQKCDITLKSDNFRNATVTYTGSTLNAWTNDGAGTITLRFPYDSSNYRFLNVLVENNTNNTLYRFYLLADCGDVPLPHHLTVSNDGQLLTVTLKQNESMKSFGILENNSQINTLSIINTITGDVVYSYMVNAPSTTINTELWKSGVYVISATVGKEILTKKIVIK